MDNKNQQQAAAVEIEGAGRGGLSQAELDQLVASSDTGARGTTGPVGMFVMLIALAWSLFQLWFASPLPFIFGFGVFNDTQARSIHLAFAIFLAFAAFPSARTKVQLALGIGVPILLCFLFMYSAKEGTPIWWIPLVGMAVAGAVWAGSPKDKIPAWEWALAVVGALTALYLLIFYQDISGRVGAPITQDFVVGVIGLIVLLEATRRVAGGTLQGENAAFGQVAHHRIVKLHEQGGPEHAGLLITLPACVVQVDEDFLAALQVGNELGQRGLGLTRKDMVDCR